MSSGPLPDADGAALPVRASNAARRGITGAVRAVFVAAFVAVAVGVLQKDREAGRYLDRRSRSG